MRWRTGHDVEGRHSAPFFFILTQKKGALGRLLLVRYDLLGGSGELALVASSGVLVDQTFTRRTIEQLDGLGALCGGAGSGALERGTQRGFLGAIADRRGP